MSSRGPRPRPGTWRIGEGGPASELPEVGGAQAARKPAKQQASVTVTRSKCALHQDNEGVYTLLHVCKCLFCGRAAAARRRCRGDGRNTRGLDALLREKLAELV